MSIEIILDVIDEYWELMISDFPQTSVVIQWSCKSTSLKNLPIDCMVCRDGACCNWPLVISSKMIYSGTMSDPALRYADICSLVTVKVTPNSLIGRCGWFWYSVSDNLMKSTSHMRGASCVNENMSDTILRTSSRYFWSRCLVDFNMTFVIIDSLSSKAAFLGVLIESI